MLISREQIDDICHSLKDILKTLADGGAAAGKSVEQVRQVREEAPKAIDALRDMALQSLRSPVSEEQAVRLGPCECIFEHHPDCPQRDFPLPKGEDTLRESAAPQGEPYCWMRINEYSQPEVCDESHARAFPVYLAPAQPAVEWIPVSERVPERGTFVLITWGSSPSFAVAKFGGKRWIDKYDSKGVDFAPPTHWRPLPEPPHIAEEKK